MKSKALAWMEACGDDIFGLGIDGQQEQLGWRRVTMPTLA